MTFPTPNPAATESADRRSRCNHSKVYTLFPKITRWLEPFTDTFLTVSHQFLTKISGPGLCGKTVPWLSMRNPPEKTSGSLKNCEIKPRSQKSVLHCYSRCPPPSGQAARGRPGIPPPQPICRSGCRGCGGNTRGGYSSDSCGNRSASR